MTIQLKTAFPPIVDKKAKLLILGSMPGESALAAGQYYAFERNAFWPVMGELVGASFDLPYRQRLKKVQQHGIALWNVIAKCERKGSLDSAINKATLVVNDFSAFLDQWPGIERIFFNGKYVQQLFKSHVLKTQRVRKDIEMVVLPCTSPAHARCSFEEKLLEWRKMIGPLQSRP